MFASFLVLTRFHVSIDNYITNYALCRVGRRMFTLAGRDQEISRGGVDIRFRKADTVDSGSSMVISGSRISPR